MDDSNSPALSELKERPFVRSLATFLRFCRSHTIIATSLQVTGLFIVAISAQNGGFYGGSVWFWALIASLSANVYIVGLNQLVDVDIDRINKPQLPLASGDLSMRQGRWIVFIMAVTSSAIALSQSPILLATVLISMVIGSLYSLEPFHLKRRPFWAAVSIAFVRGFVANLGMLAHFYLVLHPEMNFPIALGIGLAVFFFGFGLVIALYKDMPDLIGDRSFDIRTYSVRLGPDRVFRTGRWIFTGFYFIPMLWGITQLPDLSGAVVLVSQAVILGVFWRRSSSVKLDDRAGVTRFYMFLWTLFYVEYMLLALAAILS
ncbi:MAG: homogentisate phytyltransferase [Candidatus Promineifilaceae bacterium]|jgi:homogentisate phytyltransferase/homogentisate geranylgeranyltransferase